jgi:hypothetical protein
MMVGKKNELKLGISAPVLADAARILLDNTNMLTFATTTKIDHPLSLKYFMGNK